MAIKSEHCVDHPLHRALLEALEPLCNEKTRDRVLTFAAMAYGDDRFPIDVFEFSEFARGPLNDATLHVLGPEAAQSLMSFVAPILMTASSGAHRRGSKKQTSAARRITPTVLVVDNDIATRAGVVSLIERQKLKVHTCEDAMEAIGRCAELRPDIVIASQELPGVSGAQLAAMLQRSYGVDGPKVIVISDNPEHVPRKSASLEVVARPVDPVKFLMLIEYCARLQRPVAK